MRYYERAYQRILFGVASLRRNKVDRGKARVCHFGPYRDYRKNEAAPNKIPRYAIYFHPIECAQQVSASAVQTELRSPFSRDTYKNIHPSTRYNTARVCDPSITPYDQRQQYLYFLTVNYCCCLNYSDNYYSYELKICTCTLLYSFRRYLAD